MKNFKRIILITVLLICFMFGGAGGAELHKINVVNDSCLLAFIAITKVEFNEDGGLKEMVLHYSSWLEPNEKGVIYLTEGHVYAMYSEGWRWNPDTKQPTVRVGATYKEGRYSNKITGNLLIIKFKGKCENEAKRFNI